MFTTNQLFLEVLEPTYAQKCFAENRKLRTESKMVYSTPYVGNYVYIILVMLEAGMKEQIFFRVLFCSVFCRNFFSVFLFCSVL